MQTFADKCPDSKITMSGYSQGGQVVHKAAQQLSAAAKEKVSSVVIFGDPNNGQPVAGVPKDKTLVVCRDGDNICEGGFRVLAPHLQYGSDAEMAAEFIVKQANSA